MWIPFPGAQEEFCSRGEFEVLYGGQAGPGKTDCLVALATRMIGHPKYHGLLLRRTFPQLQEIIDRCHDLYPKLGGVYKATEHRWYFASGAKITLGHMQHENDKYNYQGKEFQFIGFDELTQFTETQYLYLFSRCRSSVQGLPAKIRCSTNPGGLGHRWVRERFVSITDPCRTYFCPVSGLSRCFIPGSLTDNPALMDNDPGYRSRLDGLPEIERMRLRDGVWDAFEGQVFTELSKRVHGCDAVHLPPEWYRFMAFDWGFSKPFACLWFAVDYEGNLWLYREWYGCKEKTEDVGLKMSTGDIIAGIREREFEKISARIADPAIWSRTPNHLKYGIKGPSVEEDMRCAGMHFLKADNDRVQGKQQVHKRLEIARELDPETGEVIDESPRFFAFNDCHHFWRTMPEMKEHKNNPEDVDSDTEDHIYDTFRYACMFRPVQPKVKNQEPANTFSSERKRLLRAQQYARSRGVSLDKAYRRVR